MADTYTTGLRARRIEQDAYSGSGYADRLNEDMVDIHDAGITGTITIDIGSDTTYALEAMQFGTLSETHHKRIEFIGTPASAVLIIVPDSVAAFKEFVIDNQTGQLITVKYSTTPGVRIPNGVAAMIAADGEYVEQYEIGEAITDEEVSALAAITDLGYRIATPYRYGADGLGASADTAAIQDAKDVLAAAVGFAQWRNGLSIPGYLPTAAEASIAIYSYSIKPGFVRRYSSNANCGNGIVDDTAAVNAAFAQAAAGGSPVRGYEDDVYLCGPLTETTASDIIVEDFYLRVKPDSWSGETTHVNFNGGTGHRLKRVTIDGNQSAFTAPVTGRLLQFDGSCSGLVLEDVSVINSPSVGLRDYSKSASFTRCIFDDAAGLGSEHITITYHSFSKCKWRRNGYGYQQTRATNAFVAFGMAVRYRSHHFVFVDCEWSQNGRDGGNVNQGSYAYKFIACLGWDNEDGGLTIAADNASSGLPGEGESCYDGEYIDCEGYNNFSAGLAIYDPAYNITVRSGRYYNNGRVVGVQAFESAYPNGIFVGPGSRGINIDTKAYDDRQLRVVASVSGSGSTRTLTATGWITGSMTAYPRVALYNASNAFQGYGTITAEASGSVTISATANNGVTLGSITGGWKVTQRVQHNGVMLDNGCQSVVKVDGFGFLPGPQEYTGWKVVSGYLGNSQNVLVPDCALEDTELLANPTWDAATTNWTFSTPGGGSSAVHTGANRRSPGSLVLIGGSSDAVGDSTLITDGLKYALSAFVEASCWVYADAADDAAILFLWTAGSAFFSAVSHPGGGWKKLTVGAFMPPSATSLQLRVQTTATKTAYFDNASLRVRAPHIDGNDTTSFSRYLSV